MRPHDLQAATTRDEPAKAGTSSPAPVSLLHNDPDYSCLIDPVQALPTHELPALPSRPSLVFSHLP
jgi:hypothetical protein